MTHAGRFWSFGALLTSTLALAVGCQAPSGQGDVQVRREALAVAPGPMRIDSAPDSCTLSVGINWDTPPGVPLSAIAGYQVLRDGRPITWDTFISVGLTDTIQLLPGGTYQYQVAWRDQSGVLSAFNAPLQVTMPPVCARPEYADGKVTLAAVLFKFDDAPPVPFTPDQARSWIFQDPNGAAAYMQEISRGRVTVQGDVYGWLSMHQLMSPRCTVSADGFRDCHLTADELLNLATAAGVPVGNYERVAFYVDGTDVEGFTTNHACVMQGSHGAISTGTLVHECFGHGFGLMHAGDWQCGPAAGVGPSLIDGNQDGVCTVTRYGDSYDAMGVSAHDFSTQNLYLLGLLGDQERVDAQAGGTYWLGKLSSSVHPIKQLRLPLQGKIFYFAEYRAAEGFNALTNCDDCAPRLNGEFVPSPGLYVRMWRDTRVHSVDGQDDVNTLNVTNFPFRPGQSFYDPYRGIKIVSLAEDADGAQVKVAFCGNNIKDGDETDVDCGGTCAPCADGKACGGAQDCQNQVCTAGVCTHSCSDQVKNGNEVDVDCGGSCAACANGKVCGADADCQSARCSYGKCAPPLTCFDSDQEYPESDLDCGGPLCAGCSLGAHCYTAADCASGYCGLGRCMALCNDRVKNGVETDVDCGGGSCSACGVGLGCHVNADCTSGVCGDGRCVPSTCANGEQDYPPAESDVDCGSGCAKCALGLHCYSPADCASGYCGLGRCMALCNDRVKNGAETDVDCGGGSCGGCAVGRSCQLARDCATGVCASGKCVPATCGNGEQDDPPAESDVDCGSGCAKCALGAHCYTAADCASGYCGLGRCMALCNDRVKNGSETDVDCGGSCAPCSSGFACATAHDCASGNCVGGFCHL
jgi:hypothetical protein